MADATSIYLGSDGKIVKNPCNEKVQGCAGDGVPYPSECQACSQYCTECYISDTHTITYSDVSFRSGCILAYPYRYLITDAGIPTTVELKWGMWPIGNPLFTFPMWGGYGGGADVRVTTSSDTTCSGGSVTHVDFFHFLMPTSNTQFRLNVYAQSSYGTTFQFSDVFIPTGIFSTRSVSTCNTGWPSVVTNTTQYLLIGNATIS